MPYPTKFQVSRHGLCEGPPEHLGEASTGSRSWDWLRARSEAAQHCFACLGCRSKSRHRLLLDRGPKFGDRRAMWVTPRIDCIWINQSATIGQLGAPFVRFGLALTLWQLFGSKSQAGMGTWGHSICRCYLGRATRGGRGVRQGHVSVKNRLRHAPHYPRPYQPTP